MTEAVVNFQGRKFHWAWWAILLNLLVVFFLLSAILMLGLSVGLLSIAASEAGAGLLRMLWLVCFGPMLLVLAVLTLPVILQVAGGILFSFLKTSPTGMEYRRWPNYGLRCQWEDVERRGVSRVLGFIPNEVLYLKKAEPVGWQLTMSLRQRLGLRQRLVVPLTGMQGWPNGQLAEELRRYIPEIMAGRANGGQDDLQA